jgi:hypothetical protein
VAAWSQLAYGPRCELLQVDFDAQTRTGVKRLTVKSISRGKASDMG